MAEPTIADFGTWSSPIAAQLLTQSGVRLSQPRLFERHCYWLEARPSEQGRSLVVRDCGRGPEDVSPPTVSVRSSVNEYGGGDYTLARCNDEATLFFVNAEDQQIYLQRIGQDQITAISNQPGCRYADLLYCPELHWLIAVEECHEASSQPSPHEPVHRLVAFSLHDSRRQVLAEGADFYASPALSPSGRQLVWLSWQHPNMPWDHNELWLADLTELGVHEARNIAPPASSSFQPQWSPQGQLFAVNDASGWWNLCQWRNGQWHNCLPMEAEFATPQWVFGMSCYGFTGDNTLLAFYTRDGLWHAGELQLDNERWQPLNWPYTDLSGLHCEAGSCVFLAADPANATAVVRWRERDFARLKASVAQSPDPRFIAQPRPVAFATGEGEQAFGFYYPPTNPNFRGPDQQQPPLIVLSHGGPTGATGSALNLKIQFWTSRGFAVMDVNYRGSTGYGRAFRNRLRGAWGLADVEDVCSAADYAVQQGWADPARLIIKGSSAGGYTVLAALTFTETFCAGTSLYGIGDLTALARDTHKFESRYLDGLVAPWPAGEAEYRARSPLFQPERIRCPVIFFQGLKDRVVPPGQAETMHAALAKQGITSALVTFANEGHGFREAQAIVDQLELELAFYGRLFGFTTSPARPDLDDYLSRP